MLLGGWAVSEAEASLQPPVSYLVPTLKHPKTFVARFCCIGGHFLQINHAMYTMYIAMVGDHTDQKIEALLANWGDAHQDRRVEAGRIPKQLQSLLSPRLTMHKISVKIMTKIYHQHI